MAIHSRDLLSLPVETKSGRPLGKVVGFFMDPMGHKITAYEVGHGLFTKAVDHLISEQQVLSISSAKMVVEDATLKSALGGRAPVSSLRKTKLQGV